MEKNSILKNRTEKLTVVGRSSRNLHDAYNNCFTQMRTELSKAKDEVIVQLNLVDIEKAENKVEQGKSNFMSKGKKEYQVEMTLVVDVKYLKVEEIER